MIQKQKDLETITRDIFLKCLELAKNGDEEELSVWVEKLERCLNAYCEMCNIIEYVGE